MNDITALAKTLRLAAESEIAHRAGGDTSDLWQDEASPENLLALVEALEKAQRHANLTEAERQAYLGLIAERDARIAELESRTVTVTLPHDSETEFVSDRSNRHRKAKQAAGIGKGE